MVGYRETRKNNKLWVLGGLTAFVIFGVLLFQPRVNRAVSEWERMSPPPELDTPATPTTLFGATAAFNPTLAARSPQLGGYFAWAVGAKFTDSLNQQAVAMRFNRYNWETKVIGDGTADRLNGVATWLDDRGTPGVGSDDLHRVWAVGQKGVYPNPYTPPTGTPEGVMIYSETNSTTGTATPWSNCVTNHTTGVCDPITFTGGPPRVFNDVDFVVPYYGLAVSDNCEVWRTGDYGVTWVNLVPLPGCTNLKLTSVTFTHDYTGYDPATSLNVTHSGYAWITAAGTDKVWFSPDAGFSSWIPLSTGVPAQNWNDVTAFTHPSLGVNNNLYAWIVGDGGHIRRIICTAGNPASCQSAAFTDAGPSGQAGLGNVTLRSATAFIDTASPIKYMLWASAGSTPIPPPTAVPIIPPATPTDGAIAFTLNPTATLPADVLWQSQSINSAQSIYGVAVVNGTHAWAVGDQTTLLKLSPGNLNGWLWIGADNCKNLCTANIDCLNAAISICQGGTARTRPLGWLSVNCANTGTCQAATFNYGVNLKQKKEPVGPVTNCQEGYQDTDVGALSGFGWFGVSDQNQIDPDIPNVPPGHNVCANNPAACRPIGWLSFERTYFCTGNLQKTCRQNSDCIGVGTCDIAGGTPPGQPFNSFNFTSACAKTITNNTPQQYVQALYDYATDRVDGWARFVAPEHLANDTGWVKLRGPYMCGTAWCVKDRSRACSPVATLPGPCVAGDSCDYSQAGAQPYDACRTTSSPVNPASDTHYVKCTDCVTNPGADVTIGTADDFLKCNICTHEQTTDWWDITYQRRHQLRVQMGNTDAETIDTISFPIDLDAAPFLGDVQADYDDVRVVYQTESGFYELQRDIVKFPGVVNEEIRFKAVNFIAANTFDDSYFLYYGNGSVGAPTLNRSNVYPYFSDFSTNVFASGEWLTTNCNSRIVYDAATERIRSVIGADCYAFTNSPGLNIDVIGSGYNIEALISTEAGAIAQGSVAMIQSTAGGKVWAGFVDSTNEAFARGTPPTNLIISAPVPGGITTGVQYSVHWLERPNGLGNRWHTVWVNGQSIFSNAIEANPQFSIAWPGVHTWQSIATWDDFRIWKYLGETVTLAPHSEEPLNFVQKAINPWSCNLCGSSGASGNTQCGTGRCLPSAPAKPFNVCLTDAQCEPASGADTNGRNDCSPVGRCSDTGAICFGNVAGGSPGFCNSSPPFNSTCLDAGENVCNECATCSLYGVSADTHGGALYGFGYSEDFGFVDFSFSFLYNRSWLQVLRGSIYSRSSVGSPTTGKAPGIGSSAAPPESRCNATFVIRSNGSVANVCSSYQTTTPSQDPTISPYLNPSSTKLDLPTKDDNNFKTDAGSLRVDELLADTGGGKNKFKQTIVDIGPTGLWGPTGINTLSAFLFSVPNPTCLGNRIFYRKASTPFTFDVPWTTIRNCPGSFGRGTFVFEGGSVVMNENMAYDTATSSAQTINELAALGIMVIRDRTIPIDVSATIAKGVRNTIGNFYVEGDIVIEGSATSTQPDDPFQNDGVMVARGFKFGRRIKGPIDNPQPSEIILNDGRLSLNPPPGFEGFSQNFPQIKQALP